jgi:hypothetical protein
LSTCHVSINQAPISKQNAPVPPLEETNIEEILLDDFPFGLCLSGFGEIFAEVLEGFGFVCKSQWAYHVLVLAKKFRTNFGPALQANYDR